MELKKLFKKNNSYEKNKNKNVVVLIKTLLLIFKFKKFLETVIHHLNENVMHINYCISNILSSSKLVIVLIEMVPQDSNNFPHKSRRWQAGCVCHVVIPTSPVFPSPTLNVFFFSFMLCQSRYITDVTLSLHRTPLTLMSAGGKPTHSLLTDTDMTYLPFS